MVSLLTNKTSMQLLVVVAAFTLATLALIYFDLEIPRSYYQTTLQSVGRIRAMVQTKLLGAADRSDNSTEVIRIMYVNHAFGSPDWKWGVGSAPLRDCPHLIGWCEFTSNRSLANESDVLLFHIQGVRKDRAPEFRSPHQKWIFANLESPVSCVRKVRGVDVHFNLTMSYVHSAENNVYWSYGSCVPKTDNSSTNSGSSNGTAGAEQTHINYARGKKHLVAWFVGNCNATSGRQIYVHEMQKHADVHIYGCGSPYRCPKSKIDYCDKVLLNNDYKFYLSFENSLCKDYVTEKLWRAMSVNVVPVVLGYANYSQWLPTHSYIDVRDFPSPKHLADYLKLLDANDALYNEYFRWKARYRCGFTIKNNACELCRYLHQAYGREQRVGDVHNFWDPKKYCIKRKDFYRPLGLKI